MPLIMFEMAISFDIGFLGGGQLARMSIQAAQKIGALCLSLDPSPQSPASQIAPAITAPLNDPEALRNLTSSCAFLALENEFVPADAIEEAIKDTGREPFILSPGLGTLRTIQDKLRQREAYAEHKVPSPRAAAIDDDGASAVARIGFPMVLKARFGGYDGRAVRAAETPQDFEDLRGVWGDGGWMAEEFVPFKRELAVMVMRWRVPTFDPLVEEPPKPENQKIVAQAFPTMESVQANHMCDLVFPADVDASEVAIRAVESLGGVGLFGVELFEKDDGTIVVNEVAPRPHNSGHYTLDWGGPSQFEQHVRLVLGLPPIPLDGLPTCMANLIGQPRTGNFRLGVSAVLAQDPGVRVHWYGKAESRAGRKMGHLNVVGENMVERAKAARDRFYNAWSVAKDDQSEVYEPD